MGISYDMFSGAFLAKITEYDFINIAEENRTAIIDGYLKRALVAFKKNCRYDLLSNMDDDAREIGIEVKDEDVDELVDIISEGMVVQWLKPYVHHQENLENALSTRDFSVFSPAELLNRIVGTYKEANKIYTQMIREYSYNHGNIKDFHL